MMSNGITSSSNDGIGSILVVDEEEHISSLLKYNLENEGYCVETMNDAAAASHADLPQFRIILADAMNRAFTGRDLLKAVKANPLTAHIPVIILSYSDSEDDIIAAFNDGADDYILKPFSLRELIARVRSVLRRNPIVAAGGAHTAIIKAGNLDIDLSTRTVRTLTSPLPLTKTEFAILALLAKNKNTFFSRRQIYHEVWAEGERNDNDRIVDTNISRLRKKLGDDSSIIINKSGLGYAIQD